MKASIKQKRLAELFGIPTEAVPLPQSPEVKAEQGNISREAEGVIAFFREPRAFTEKRCGTCNRIFMVNRSNISQCSDICRTTHLLNNLGLEVDLKQRTPEERWAYNTGGPEPLIVPPAVIDFLAERYLHLAMGPQQEQASEQSPQYSETPTPDPNPAPVELDVLAQTELMLRDLGL